MTDPYTACEHGRTTRHLVITEHRGNTYHSYCHGLTEVIPSMLCRILLQLRTKKRFN